MRFTSDDERLIATPNGAPDSLPRRKSRLVLVAVIAVFALAAVAAVWYVGQALMAPGGQSTGELPLLVADTSPVKARPDDPGGVEIQNRDKLVYKSFDGAAEEQPVEQLLPAPEEPMQKPVDPGPRAAPLVNETPETIFPKPTQNDAIATLAPAIAEPPVVSKQELPPPSETPKPKGDAASADPVAPREAPKAVEGATVAAPKETVAKASIGVPGGAIWLQLAALRDEAGAKAEWARLSTRHAAALGNLDNRIVRADLGAKGVWFRIQAGPFADRTSADTTCRTLVAEGANCKVVMP